MKKILLEIVVFICGAVVMIYELAGSRVLGPFLGTSLFIWTSLIGIILGSLSLGYYIGGKVSDKNPSFSTLGWVILVAAVLVLITTLIKDSFLNHLSRNVSGLKWQAVIASIFLFAPASVLLGIVSPYAVKLKLHDLESSGTTVGTLYAISTVGSIAGTFAAGFFLIPVMGTTLILYFIVIVLILTGLSLFIHARIKGAISISVMIMIVPGWLYWEEVHANRTYIDTDTRYSRVIIYNGEDYRTGKQVKYMRINNEWSSAMFLDNDSLVLEYSLYYLLAEHFNPGFKSSLMLGGAAYSFPKYYLMAYPEAMIDVVEIDPELTRLAREHFRLKDDPRMEIIHEDGRTFMNNTQKKYDIFYGDAYKSLYTIPWHLTTVEAAQKTYDLLNDGGVAFINIISTLEGKGSEFLRAEVATFKSIFPFVYVFAVHDSNDPDLLQSTLLIAVKSTKAPSLQSDNPAFSEYLKHEISDRLVLDKPVLTDDHAPVDYYTNKAL